MANTLTETQVLDVQTKAKAIRRNIVKMITEAKSGHPGGSLSATDIVTTLYFAEMNVDPENPKAPDRDRFVLSKGHAAPVLYATLAAKGYFPEEELMALRQVNTRMQGHPSMKDLPGVDMSTGSLGQGLAAANGMALAARLDGSDHRIFVLMGDGELQEGMIWEAAMLAGHYKLSNVTAFVDYNGLQIDGNVADVMSPLPLADKWRAFQWNVIEIDGHDIPAIYDAIQAAKAETEKPTVILAKTVKGKGVSFMENQAGWHGNAPSKEQCEQVLAEDLA